MLEQLPEPGVRIIPGLLERHGAFTHQAELWSWLTEGQDATGGFEAERLDAHRSSTRLHSQLATRPSDLERHTQPLPQALPGNRNIGFESGKYQRWQHHAYVDFARYKLTGWRRLCANRCSHCWRTPLSQCTVLSCSACSSTFQPPCSRRILALIRPRRPR